MKRGWTPMEKEQTLQLETGENQQAMKPLRVVVVGKSGSGKSSLCNQLARNHQELFLSVFPTGQNLGQSLHDVFPVGHGLKTVTTRCHEETIGGLTIVDTSDNIDEIVRTQKHHIYVKDCRVLLVLCIRCDARFAAEEYNVYRELKDAWGNDADFCRRLVVAFTYGDKLDSEESLDEKLKVTWPQLQRVLQDAREQYVLFHKVGTNDTEAVKELSNKTKDMELSLRLLTVIKDLLQNLPRKTMKRPKQAFASVGLVFVVWFGLIMSSAATFVVTFTVFAIISIIMKICFTGLALVVIFDMVTEKYCWHITKAVILNMQGVFADQRPAKVY